MSDIDIDALRAWVGRERNQTDALPLSQARALAAALDHPLLPQDGDALPPAWQWIYFLDTPSASSIDVDGHPRLGEFLPPAPLPRRMWAAGSMQCLRPLRIGQAASRHSLIKAIDAKSGKSGALVFVTLEHRISQSDRLCLIEQQNLVYRELPPAPVPLPPGEVAPVKADWSRLITPDPVLLFRYSALTYNAHRIHYDRHYAVEREFYPALVVHGPLLATLLLDLLHQHCPDVIVRDFQFRALRPTFDTHPFMVCGRREAETVQLWSADHEGHLCVSATATIGVSL